jgi:hypothetical protein
MNAANSKPECTLSVTEAIDYWLEYRQSEVRGTTLKSYKQTASYIVGPLLVGTKVERYNFSRTAVGKAGAQFIQMLGPTQVTKLTTAQIRAWHKTVTAQVGSHTANAAKKFLRAALCLVAEDFSLAVPAADLQRTRRSWNLLDERCCRASASLLQPPPARYM